MNISYNHDQNTHSLEGPRVAFDVLFKNKTPRSLLDFGCGLGTWISSSIKNGVDDVFGVDGVDIPKEKLLFPADRFRVVDLRSPLDLGRRFDVVICFEVAEHLDSTFANVLVDTLVRHSDSVYFSAACPGQNGQNHINCQWPSWWQEIFNARGYRCDDSVRWALWNEKAVEPWYRQNMFIATKDPTMAGTEPKLRPVIHPEMLRHIRQKTDSPSVFQQIETGMMPPLWYVQTPIKGIISKVRRRFKS